MGSKKKKKIAQESRDRHLHIFCYYLLYLLLTCLSLISLSQGRALVCGRAGRATIATHSIIGFISYDCLSLYTWISNISQLSISPTLNVLKRFGSSSLGLR